MYQTLTYRLIEAEPTLADAQAKMLAAHSGRLAWSSPDELASGTLGIVGCIVSNELVDALPVHLVEMTTEGVKEVLVSADGDQFCEKLSPFLSPGIEEFLEKNGISLAVGQRAEIRLVADRWITGVASSLKTGFVITIDYGYLAQELYGRMRTNGTLLCYYCHQLEENPYIRVGMQDITAHVDFSALIRSGAGVGLEKIWYGEQYRFLMAAGMMQELLALEALPVPEQQKIKDRLALKKLMLPDGGMGDTFKVLVQGKNVGNPDLLCLRDWSASL
jgi:SAM-dependent MidA family methyltransferase